MACALILSSYTGTAELDIETASCSASTAELLSFDMDAPLLALPRGFAHALVLLVF